MDPNTKEIALMWIDEALDRHRIRSAALRKELIARAATGGGYSPEIRIQLDLGEPISIDRAIEHFKADPRFRGHFPPEPPQVSLKDSEGMRKNFARIASGEVRVTK